MENFADTHGTSIEIVKVIFERANNDKKIAEEIWDNGIDSEEIIKAAFASCDEEVLCWGIESYFRTDFI